MLEVAIKALKAVLRSEGIVDGEETDEAASAGSDSPED
jgi:hypothetical protein